MAGIKDLLRTAVNLMHWLMEKHVAESTGWRGCALYTDQGLDGMAKEKLPLVDQRESYEHLEEAKTHIMVHWNQSVRTNSKSN